MPLTELQRRRVIQAFCLVFYLLMLLKLYNGLFLFQLKPFLFNNRFDLAAWLLMKTGMHKWLLNNWFGWIMFDAAFYALPVLYLFAYKKSMRLASAVAIAMLPVNWFYIQCYTLYPSVSIEGSIAWLLFPFLFIAADLKTFYFILQGLRFFFLYFFTSAVVWKLVQGGFFNMSQMSGILLFQHKEYLTSSPMTWYSIFIYWLIKHPFTSYCLYFIATVLEAVFVIGFFTRKYDSWLIAATVLFLFADYFFMRIPYWEVAPFIITLLFSKYSLPEPERGEREL